VNVDMRVLAVIHHPIFGGPHNQTVRLAQPLFHRGWETVVAVPLEEGNAQKRLHDHGVPVLTTPLHRLRATKHPREHFRLAVSMLPDIRALRNLIRVHSIDLVQLCGLVNPHAAIAARLESRPVVWQLLDTRAPMALRLATMPVVKRLADVVMTTGATVADMHPGVSSLGERLVVYVPPVDTVAFRPDKDRRATARARLGVPTDGILVGTLGNLNPQKGHEYLLRAAARLRPVVENLYVRILGAETPTHRAYGARLASEATSLGLTEDSRFSIIDPNGDAELLLPAFDLFALTSVHRSEGIPTVVIEAMSCGLPVVATDVGGVREVVEEATTGLLARPGDAVAVAEALRRLLRDPEMRLQMSKAARARVESDLSLEACADAHAEAYCQALRRHQRERRHLALRSLRG
jgi:glycosyltransferase involved in cell wall biosynthesis